jgi:hypothetical protein
MRYASESRKPGKTLGPQKPRERGARSFVSPLPGTRARVAGKLDGGSLRPFTPPKGSKRPAKARAEGRERQPATEPLAPTVFVGA